MTGGELIGPDVEVEGVSIDSRQTQPGELFVPVVAERDGHDFIPGALAAGAHAFLTAGPVPYGTAEVVDDTRVALAALGAAARARLGDRVGDRVVAVTGSVGKTTVKDLLAAALTTRWPTTASTGSFNNELGVPLTLLAAPEGTEAVVVEMGARAPGDLRLLCELARPSVGVVTNVGLVHTETFGSIDDVARAKAELVESLPAGGTAVLNGDDALVSAMAAKTTAASVLRFGLASGADVIATDVTLDAQLRPSFRLHSPWGEAEVQLAVRGNHQVSNALAAAAAALVCDVEPAAVAEGLARASLSPWRMELLRSPAGALILNDAYNANPVSVAGALRALAALDARRRIAVLGTMAELGDVSVREHRAMAALAAEFGIRLVAVGEDAYGVEVVAGVEEAVAAVGLLGEGDAVLVKGSRVAGLELLAARLSAPPPA